MAENYDFESDELKEKVEALQAALAEEQQKQIDEEMEHTETEINGSEVDWDDYELDPEFAHHYKTATFKKIGEEFRWVAKLTEFLSVSKGIGSSGFHEKTGEPKNFGQYLTWMVNGPEGWRIAQIWSNGSGQASALLQRVVAVALPDPAPVLVTTEVEAPDDAELTEIEDKSLAWAGAENGQPDSNGESGE